MTTGLKTLAATELVLSLALLAYFVCETTGPAGDPLLWVPAAFFVVCSVLALLHLLIVTRPDSLKPPTTRGR